MEKTLTFDQLPSAVNQLNIRLDNIEKILLQQSKQQPTEQPERFLTVQQAAKLLNLTVPTIYGKVHRNELPVMKRGKRLYFSEKELMKYIKDGRKKTNAEIEAEAEKYLSNN